MDQVRHIAEVDGWLCGCGTYVESEGKTLLNRLMPVQQVQRIARLAVDCDADIFLEGPGVCYYCSQSGRMPFGQQLRKNFGNTIEWLEPESVCGEINKFCILTDDQSDRTRTVSESGSGYCGDRPGRGLLRSAFRKDLPKLQPLMWCWRTYGLTLEDAYVFGDSTNDIAMFEHVPNAVLMGKHSPELEPYASFLTKTVEQDGIWYAMEKLGLLSEEV